MTSKLPRLLTVLALLLALSVPLAGGTGAASAHPLGASAKAERSKAEAKRHTKAHRRHVRRSKQRAQRRRLQQRKRQSSRIGTGAIGSAVAVGSRSRPAAPQPAAAEADGNYFSGHSISDFEINHSAPGAVTEPGDPAGSGGPAIEMNVNNADVYPITPTENPRAELISPPIVDPGDEVWLHTRFYVPADYPSVPEGGWVSLVSFYGPPFNGPSPFHLELCGERLQWQRNGTYNWDVPYQTPLVRGRWIDVLVHERFASDGWIELWIDGQQIEFFASGGANPSNQAPTTRLNMATMDSSNDGGPNAAKIMQYRQLGMFQQGALYFSGLELGPTRESVGA